MSKTEYVHKDGLIYKVRGPRYRVQDTKTLLWSGWKSPVDHDIANYISRMKALRLSAKSVAKIAEAIAAVGEAAREASASVDVMRETIAPDLLGAEEEAIRWYLENVSQARLLAIYRSCSGHSGKGLHRPDVINAIAYDYTSVKEDGTRSKFRNEFLMGLEDVPKSALLDWAQKHYDKPINARRTKSEIVIEIAHTFPARTLVIYIPHNEGTR